ncbi:MAG: hypothetical protein LBE08_03655 [Bifidobacteriaceae bacterium]|nr:hypothetical protein [Bifidobacteriaceae bacterium]
MSSLRASARVVVKDRDEAAWEAPPASSAGHSAPSSSSQKSARAPGSGVYQVVGGEPASIGARDRLAHGLHVGLGVEGVGSGGRGEWLSAPDTPEPGFRGCGPTATSVMESGCGP